MPSIPNIPATTVSQATAPLGASPSPATAAALTSNITGVSGMPVGAPINSHRFDVLGGLEQSSFANDQLEKIEEAGRPQGSNPDRQPNGELETGADAVPRHTEAAPPGQDKLRNGCGSNPDASGSQTKSSPKIEISSAKPEPDWLERNTDGSSASKCAGLKEGVLNAGESICFAIQAGPRAIGNALKDGFNSNKATAAKIAAAVATILAAIVAVAFGHYIIAAFLVVVGCAVLLKIAGDNMVPRLPKDGEPPLDTKPSDGPVKAISPVESDKPIYEVITNMKTGEVVLTDRLAMIATPNLHPQEN